MRNITPIHRPSRLPARETPTYTAATLVAAALVLVLGAAGCGIGSERTLVTVGDRHITVAEFEDAARERPYLALDPAPDSKQRLLDELIDRALLVHMARSLGYDKSGEMAGVRREARETVLQEMLYEHVVTDRVRTTEEEARALWQGQDEEWRISQIFVFQERDAHTVQAALRRGQTFPEVAQAHSRDLQSAPDGGDIGYVTAGQLPASIETAVRRLPSGQWTGPLRTPLGYYFVQVTDRRARERMDFEVAQGPIQSLLEQRKARAIVLAYLARVKERAHLRIDPSGMRLLSQKWQNRRAEELLASGGDPRRLGFTEAELGHPLVRYDGGAYTVRDFFADLDRGQTAARPPSTNDAALRLFLEDRASGRLLTREAERRGLDRDPGAQRRSRDREESRLVTLLYENVVVPRAMSAPQPREPLAQQGTIEGDPATRERLLADLQAREFEASREVALRSLLDSLRQATKPRIDESAWAAVPWPVPPKETP